MVVEEAYLHSGCYCLLRWFGFVEKVSLTLKIRINTEAVMKNYNEMDSYKSSLLIAALVLVASQAASADTFEKLEDNWYIGGGIGQSGLTPDGGDTWDVSDDNDISKKAYVGYNIGRDFGLEAFWNDFGEATVSNKDKSGAEGKVSYKAYGANLVYHVPSYMGNIHPIVKLGVGKVKTEGEGVTVNQQNKFDVMGGIGAEYALENGFRIRAEYERFDEDIDQLSVGLNWRPVLTRRVVEKPAPRPIIQAPKPAPQPIVIVNQAPAPAPVAKPAPAPKPIVKIVKQPAPKPKTIVKHVPVYVQTPAPKPVVNKTIIKQAPAPAPVVQRIVVNAPKPPAPKPQPRVIHKTLAGGSNFATNSAQLTNAGRNALNRLASDLLRDRVVIHNISIIGHTDSVGSHAANQKLSQQRANTVASYLASRGLNRSVMTVVGRGETQPTASNATAAGRAQNRRVNLVVKGSQTINR
ncbi:hypothetical protein EOL70_09145 [Leucothrix sargassi]|nr:hypothetical protein EOL70_09145 [Leucothrix sargassi]